MVAPFLKWAGGKRWLVDRVAPYIPRHATYFEPLVGGASLFFALTPRRAVLGDLNPELINCYRRVQRDCRHVVRVLRELRPGKASYYDIRDRVPGERDLVKRAAYFIFLNQLSWNGLYRVNREGNFNVPVRNHPRGKRVFDAAELFDASRMLKHAKLVCSDFEETIRDARRRDFVYFDPPYITTHLNNGFVKYNSHLFSPADELRLAAAALRLVKRGVSVMVSNAAHPSIREQYDGPFFVQSVSRRSSIAADPERRRTVAELVVSSFPINLSRTSK